MKTKTIVSGYLAFVLAVALSGNANAASLGLTTAPPTLSASSAIVDFFEFGPDGDLSAFGAIVDFTDGVSPTGLTEIGFGVGYPIANPTIGATGGFSISDDDGLFLGGDVIAVGFSEDGIELQFGNLSGSGAASFGASVLMRLQFDDALGVDPFAVLVDGDSYAASINVSNVAPVPLPAAWPLLLSAFAGIRWMQRKVVAKA